LQGFGGGLQIGLAWNQAAHLVVGDDRGLQNMRVFMAGCLGLGAGPMAISAAGFFDKAIRCSVDPGFSVMFPFVACAPCIQIVLFLQSQLLSLHEASDLGTPPKETSTNSQKTKATVVFLCLCMLILRNLTLASIEVGSAELLQTNYGYGKAGIGFGVSTFFFFFRVAGADHL